MLLLVDVGNTHTRLVLWRDGAALARTRVETRPDRAEREVRIALGEMTGSFGDSPEGACVASVVPAADGPLQRVLGDMPTHFVTHRSPLGLALEVEGPESVGADRLVNAAGAAARGEGPWVVVDAGTAVTVCALAEGPIFMGGAIAPGPGTSAEALASRGARLPQVPLVAPERAAGRHTVEAIQSGVVLGTAGAIEGLVRRMRRELGVEAPVLATGGAWELLGGLVELDDVTAAPDLTLEGLAQVAARAGMGAP
jgi:type III pantothenate kinase